MTNRPAPHALPAAQRHWDLNIFIPEGRVGTSGPVADQTPRGNRQNLPLATTARIGQYRAMLGETKGQFSSPAQRSVPAGAEESKFRSVSVTLSQAEQRRQTNAAPKTKWLSETFAMPFVFVALAVSLLAWSSPAQSPPVFRPFSGPTVVYPDWEVSFLMVADDDYGIEYQLLSAPANVIFTNGFDGGRPPNSWSALFDWQTPSSSAVGTTNIFIIRAVETNGPGLSATGMASIVLIALPPIHLSLSNGTPLLRLDNLRPDKSYSVIWTPILPATNWSFLTILPWFQPPSVTLADTAPRAPQRFYRITPGLECYTGNCP